MKEHQKSWVIKNKDKIKNTMKTYQQTIKGRYASYKCSAKQRGHEFSLSIEEFEFFWQKDCSYCGSSISTIGLDRIDNSIGYQADNIVACCTTCNQMKSARNKEEWLDKMYTILKHQGVVV